MTYVVLLSDVLDEGNNLLTCGGIKTAGWFVEEQQLRAGNQLTCDTDAALLASADTFTNWSADKCMLLFPEAERIEKTVNSTHAIGLRQASTQKMISWRYVYMNGKTYDELDNLAAKLNVSRTVNEPMRASSCSTYELMRRKASRD